jgi:tRNA threonylcarbamoyladenosine biosynthesis protein TsaB
MRILAADTTTPINTVALWDDETLLAETIVLAGRSHSERLLETVKWVLHEARHTLKDVDALAVSIGPGSFTGVRVGTATWKGLALGNALPLVAVPTLDALTRLGLFHNTLVCPMLDAKMGEVFAAVYRFEGTQRVKLTEDLVLPVEEVVQRVPAGTVVVLGDGVERYRERVLTALPDAVIAPPWLGLPRASAVALEALYLMQQGVETDPARAVPVYLRKSQPEEVRAKKLATQQAALKHGVPSTAEKAGGNRKP